MKKYAAVALPMLAGIEVISWICLVILAFMAIADLTGEAAKRGV